MASEAPERLSTAQLLAAAVVAVGGRTRDGQQEMADAVARAAASGEHLLVQAGTGTGKSLAYLVPALAVAVAGGRPVVVSTATLALQAQIVDRDLPVVADALAPLLGRRPTWQLVKGRRNYVCRQKVLGGFPAEEDTLFELSGDGPAAGNAAAAPASRLGREVIRLREWAERTTSGDRDELVPGVSERAWRQVSVSAQECLGGERCPLAEECHSEQARARGHEVDLVVTNHAFVAVDAFEGRQVLPEHDLLIVDEGHELVDRVTSVISEELTAGEVEAAARRAGRAGAGDTSRLEAAAVSLRAVLDPVPAGRFTAGVPDPVAETLALVRDSARDLLSQLKADPYSTGSDGARQLARASLTEVFEVVDRLLTPAGADLTDGPGGRGGPDGQDGPDGPDRPDALAPPGRPDGDGAVAGGQDPARDARGAGGHGGNGSGGAAGETASAVAERQAAVSDVTWLSRNTRSDGGTRVALHVAPLSVAGLLRERLFATRTVVLTSATLTPGGAFDTTAASLGLPRAGAADTPAGWRGLDVGSPFDYPKQAILYVARHLPSPGRDGLSPAFLDELTDLVRAAGGRTLGLFSSRRAAEQATEELRERLDTPVLCQGEDMTATLVRRFAGDAQTSLFGTLSLWQGVDVPGPACQLVVIDRIPFPRPDDPLTSARQLAVNRSGGNGFMAVAARHAALLLAQGTGRLIRSGTDRGVVAVLDSRLATARYGSYLRASLPPFWTTTDRAVALDALGRIDVGAGPLRPVAEPGARSAASDAGT